MTKSKGSGKEEGNGKDEAKEERAMPRGKGFVQGTKRKVKRNGERGEV